MEMEGGHDHSTVDPGHHKGGKVGGADRVVVGMAAVLVPPPVNIIKKQNVKHRVFKHSPKNCSEADSFDDCQPTLSKLRSPKGVRSLQ